MDSSLWMPLSVHEDLIISPEERDWTSGICAAPTGQRIQDCFFIFCCSFCAHSEEYVYLQSNYKRKLVPEDCCQKYCNFCACCIFMLFTSCQIPCGAFCYIRNQYRDLQKIRGNPCGDILTTFICCCCAHAQVDLSTAAARSPAAPAARPLITSVPLTHATTHRLWTT